MQTHLITDKMRTRLKKGHPKPNIVVLGAGFSKSFGVPLANELLKEVVDNYGTSFGSIRYINEFINDFYPDIEVGKEYPDIEDFLAMTETAAAYSSIRNSSNPGYYWRLSKITELMKTLNKVLGDYLWEFQRSTPSELITSVDKLLAYIGGNPVFVSFNYDLLLETALVGLGRKFTYGLSHNLDEISIIKPHGSINWFSTGTLNFKPLTFIGTAIEVPLTLDKANLTLKKWKESHIIIPSPVKRIELFELKKMWTGFASATNNAATVTSIGYSMPITDKLSRFVLRRAGLRGAKVTVVDPSVQAVERFKTFVTKDAVGRKDKFLDWVARL